jgi:hypothetical protein
MARGDFDFGNDPVGSIVTLMIVLVLLVFIIGVAAQFGSILTGDACKSYINTISQKEGEISGLKQQLNETNRQLTSCTNEYQRLITENVTKKDVDDLKGYYNLTLIQMNTLNQKFDQISNNYNTLQITYTTIYLSVAINLVLVIELFTLWRWNMDIFKITVHRIRIFVRSTKTKVTSYLTHNKS